MKNNMLKMFNMKNFFHIKDKNYKTYVYKIKPSSHIIIHNIYMSWLRTIYAKSHSSFPVYLNTHINGIDKKINKLYGVIEKPFQLYPSEIIIEEKTEDDFYIEDNHKLKITLIVPKQDVMQYFFQWQRYRKYWWSSITTTPSLFAVNEMKYGGSTIVDTEIVAKFENREKVVEKVSMSTSSNVSEGNASLTCCMALETALCTLLLDALVNKTAGYLRLHNKVAPYKISFALDYQDEKNIQDLRDLATLIHCKLSAKQIPTWLPSFSVTLQCQIKENLQMGVTYTAVLMDQSLENGIFHLLNSSTMLKEQVHIVDFEKYAVLLCGH